MNKQLAVIVVASMCAAAARVMAVAKKEGEPFASRVRRECLSIGHMLLLNYDILRELAAKQKIPWTRLVMKAEAMEKLDTRREGLRREDTPRDNAHRKHRRLLQEPLGD